MIAKPRISFEGRAEAAIAFHRPALGAERFGVPWMVAAAQP